MHRLWLSIVFALFVAALPVGEADAEPIFFSFELDFTTGPLAGQSFPGTLSVEGADCTAPGGLCDGFFRPDGLLDGTLLSFDVTVAGIAFSIEDDVDFPEAPIVGFRNDVIVFVDFIGVVDGNRLEIRLPLPFADDVSFTTDAGVASSGAFVPGPRLEQVPAPAGLVLFGVGLAAWGSIAAFRTSGRRWRK